VAEAVFVTGGAAFAPKGRERAEPLRRGCRAEQNEARKLNDFNGTSYSNTFDVS
jgi:hypothetical protein